MYHRRRRRRRVKKTGAKSEHFAPDKKKVLKSKAKK